MTPNPTLDQLQVFVTVAETGSFSAAARALNRAQSVVSYTIASLEAQVELALFDRRGRQPILTDAGRAMLEEARRLLGDLQRMRARIHSMKQGVEAVLSVALSTMVPTEVVVEVLDAFRERHPSVGLNLTIGELGVVMDAVMAGRAGVGIGGAVQAVHEDLVVDRIGRTSLLPVAAAGHRLARLGRPLALDDVLDEVQLVVVDASGRTKGRDFNVLSLKTWRVSDVATKHALIGGGLGWGGLPVSLIRHDLHSGRLVQLDLAAYERSDYPIYVTHRRDTPPGPAGTWLIEAFRDRLARCPDHTAVLADLARGTLPVAASADGRQPSL